MPSVVFLRGVNVGRHKRFKPADLARQLAPLGVVNVGAAGTFVVRAAAAPAKLRAELKKMLLFDTEVMICRGSEVLDLAREKPLPKDGSGTKRMVSVLAKRPRALPKLPLQAPPQGPWQVKVVGVRGPFVVSLWRRQPGRFLYPNEIVEKAFGVASTTRGWSTLAAIAALLEA